MFEMMTSTTDKVNEMRLPSPETTVQIKPATLASYSMPWSNASLFDFLRQAANAPRMYWENEKAAIAWAGCGIAAKLTAHGPGRFQTIRQKTGPLFQRMVLLNKDVPAQIRPRLFGGFAFRGEHRSEEMWAAFPAACFILPRFQLTRWQGQMWLTVNHCLTPEDDPLSIEGSLRQALEKLRVEATHATPNESGAMTNTSPGQPDVSELMSPATWQRWVTDATRRIRRGELDKVVLARARQMRFSSPIDPVKVLARLKQNYPNCYRFLFEPIPGHAFYGATPELLAEVTGPTLRTAALAGSIRRGKSPQEDEALGRKLLDTPKERIEHAHVVEAIEENLTPLMTKLHIAPEPGLCRLSNIQHIQTPIEGELAAGYDTLAVVEALHPTPALGGRPRRVALPIINQAEPVSRGWYGSPIGWLDDQHNGMFAVAIRSAVSVGCESRLFAGAGIVADSEPDREWCETQLKFKPLMDALSGADVTG